MEEIKNRITEIVFEKIAISLDEIEEIISKDFRKTYSKISFDNIITELVIEDKVSRIRLENKGNKLYIFANLNPIYAKGETEQDKKRYSKEDMMKAVRFGELYKSEQSKSLFEKRGTTPTAVLKKWLEQFNKK
jgi:hypothetical protein